MGRAGASELFQLANAGKVRKLFSCISLLRTLVLLFAASQLFPAGASFAKQGEGISIVLCTPEGIQTLSWESVTGEPAPFDTPAHDDGSRKQCHACVTSACVGGTFRIAQVFLPNLKLMTPTVVEAVTAPVFIRADSGPPLPSRSPPTFS